MCVGIASLGPLLRAEAQTGVPKNQVIATVSVGEFPDCVVVSPDSKTVYVANNGSNSDGYNSSVSVIDAFDNPPYNVEATIWISNYALYLALSPDGKTLYVSEYPPSNSGPDVVEVYDVTNPTSPRLTTTLTVGNFVEGLAVSPNGKQLYVTNGSPVYVIGRGYASSDLAVPAGSIYVFDTATNTQTNNILCNGSPFQVLFIENGKKADVLNLAGTGFIQFIQTAKGTVSNKTGAGGHIFRPSGMVDDALGTTLCVADSANYVAVCNPTDGTVSSIYPAVSSVFDLAFLGQPALTPNAQYLYVPYGRGSIAFNAKVGMIPSNNQVAMINVVTGQIIGSLISVGNDPVWAQASPDGKTLYVANNSDGTVSVIDITPN
ncbi:MAG: YncE family protein [Verrucomicrobia bacterium]|nr:YncE family protein [Verrucomicrobiota bacterium]